MKKESFRIQFGVFSTNEIIYAPIDFFMIFINNTKSQYVETKGSKRIDFLFEFSTTNNTTNANYKCASSILCIKDFDEDYPVCNIVDSFLILIDLEQEHEKAIVSFKDILAYLSTYCSLEKPIYVLGIHKGTKADKDKDKGKRISEEKITELCDENKLLYDYKETSVGDYNDIVTAFTEIYIENIETLKDYKKHSNIEISLDKSAPKGKSCIIF